MNEKPAASHFVLNEDALQALKQFKKYWDAWKKTADSDEAYQLKFDYQDASLTLAFTLLPLLEDKPQPLSSSISAAVDEAIAEEKDVFPMFDIIEDDLPSRIDAFEAAHPESIPGHTGFRAIKEPFSDKCFCPFCNSECAPDYCTSCHSELTSPASDTQIEPVPGPGLPSVVDMIQSPEFWRGLYPDESEAQIIERIALANVRLADKAEKDAAAAAQDEANVVAWTTPATEEDLMYESGDSGDLFSYDDEDDYDDRW